MGRWGVDTPDCDHVQDAWLDVADAGVKDVSNWMRTEWFEHTFPDVDDRERTYALEIVLGVVLLAGRAGHRLPAAVVARAQDAARALRRSAIESDDPDRAVALDAEAVELGAETAGGQGSGGSRRIPIQNDGEACVRAFFLPQDPHQHVPAATQPHRRRQPPPGRRPDARRGGERPTKQKKKPLRRPDHARQRARRGPRSKPADDR